MSAAGSTDPTPVAERARRVARAFDRVMWVRMDGEGDTARGVVAGVRRRRPVQLRVDGATANALADAGVPTVRGPGRETS